MPTSQFKCSLEGLTDLLFGFKHKIAITDAKVDHDSQTILITIEGDDVPDAPSTFCEYGAFYGKAIGENNPYDGDGTDLVREVRLVTISPHKISS